MTICKSAAESFLGIHLPDGRLIAARLSSKSVTGPSPLRLPASLPARAADRTAVIVMKTDPYTWTGGDAWWDVGVPEVSEREEVRTARGEHEAGHLVARQAIGEGTGRFAYETPHRTWHTLVAVGGPAAFLEVKEGPYDPATAADFAQWAPAEGEASVPRFQQWLREAGAGSLYSA